MRDVDVDGMSDLGLVSVLPAIHFVLLALLTVSFTLALRRREVGGAVFLLHLITLALMLYGITAIVESEPRFAVSYRHVGIVDYIARHNDVDPSIDAYFNWPGFFVLGSMLQAVGGKSLLALSSWAPFFFNLCFLVPLITICRWANDDRRVAWLAAWIFLSANWVGQDYLAPQSVGFLLWSSTLALLLVAFGRKFTFYSIRLRSPGPDEVRTESKKRRVLDVRSRLAIGPPGAAPPSFRPRAALLLVVVAMFAAVTTGHQLTPFPALLTIGGLTVLGYVETRALFVVLTLILLAWVSYMTTTYLSGHLDAVLNSFGTLGGNLNRSITRRVEGSPGHLLVVKVRLILTGVLWVLATLGFLRRVRAGHRDAPLVVIAAAPLLLPAFQGYGGEVVLRSFLFSLPAVSYFAAALIFPSRLHGRSRFAPVATLAVTSVLLVGFQYARYGNERADGFTHGDVQAVQTLYRLAPQGSTLVAGFENVPWKYQDYETYEYKTLNSMSGWDNDLHPAPSTLVQQMRSDYLRDGGYFIMTPSMRIAAEMYERKASSLDGVVALLRRSPGVDVVYDHGNSVIFRVLPARPTS
jgi:hypothetical protein